MLPFCSISWEHLCKAYLYSLDPALIFDPKRGRLFTIGLGEAQKRICRRREQPPTDDRRRKLEALADVRNGVLHAAVLDVVDQRALLVEYLGASEELYNERLDDGRGIPGRWGEYSSLVSALIAEPSNLAKEQVEIKKLIAARRRGEIIGTGTSSPEGDYDLIVGDLIVNRINNNFSLFARPAEMLIHGYCPVCNENDVGGYSGTITRKRGEPERALLRVSEFICAVCELHLSTTEEMEIAGVSPMLDLSVRPNGWAIRGQPPTDN